MGLVTSYNEKKNNSVLIQNQLKNLKNATPQAGYRGEATPYQASKEYKMPPKVVKTQKVDTAFANAVKAQTNGLVSLEYTSGGLKVRTSTSSDHSNMVTFLRECGVKFFFFKPNSDQ